MACQLQLNMFYTTEMKPRMSPSALERQVYTWLCPDKSFLSLWHRRRVTGLSMLYKVNSTSNHCLFSKLPCASTWFRQTRTAAAAHPLEFEVRRCRTSQFARSFLPAQVRLWDDLPITVFDTGTLNGYKSVVNRWLLPWIVFSSVFRGAGACGVAKAIYNQLVFPTWACAAGFNNNYYIENWPKFARPARSFGRWEQREEADKTFCQHTIIGVRVKTPQLGVNNLGFIVSHLGWLNPVAQCANDRTPLSLRWAK